MVNFFKFILLMILLTSCGKNSSVSKDNIEVDNIIIDFTDALGENIVIKNQPKKVAVVMGSFAEVWDLAGGDLYAVTEDTIKDGKVKLEKNIINLGTMKAPSVELMIENEIDLVILSSNIVEHVSLKDQLKDVGIQSIYFDVEVFDDYLNMLGICTEITNRKDLYKENGTDIQEKINKAISKKNTEPEILFIRAFSSGAKAKGSDSMTGAMLKDLGCINIADNEDSLLDDLSIEVIIEKDPEFIFVVTMGESEEKALAVVDELLISNPAWSELSAVKNGKYYVIEKDLFHLKPNHRWGESYEILAKILFDQK